MWAMSPGGWMATFYSIIIILLIVVIVVQVRRH